MPNQPSQFSLDMDAEVAARQAQQPRPVAPSETATEIAARIGQTMREMGIDDEAHPLAAEKVQRDLDYQRQMETLAQPDSAPILTQPTTPDLDRLETLQRELDAAKAEASRWKKEFGRREGTVGQMKAELADLKARVSQIQPPISVQQITGRAPDEPITAQDAVNLLMSQSSAFGNAMRQLREELLAQTAAPQEGGGLPLDMEAELVESHSWLTDLPRPQKLRAMHDILASAGVTVAPPQPPVASGQPAPPPTLPAAARAPVRQVAFIEPSNRGSQAEQQGVTPERTAYNERVAKLQSELQGAYKPGASDRAAELLAQLGAGPVDETNMGFFTDRRR